MTGSPVARLAWRLIRPARRQSTRLRTFACYLVHRNQPRRIKAALAAAKARGKALGGAREGAADRARQVAGLGAAAVRAKAQARAADLRPVLGQLLAEGVTGQRAIAQALNDRDIPTARGGRWSHGTVGALLRRVEVLA
jgi:Recombinase